MKQNREMMKRILSLTLAILLTLSCVPAQAFATETEPVEETMETVLEETTVSTEAETAETTEPPTVPETTAETEPTVEQTTEPTVPETMEETVPEVTVEETAPVLFSAAEESWNVNTDALSNTITVKPGQLMAETCEIVDNEIYGYVANYPLRKGHILSISNSDYVFSVRKLSDGNYNTMLKQATAAGFTATEDMTVGMLIRKPDKSALTAEELNSVVLYDSQFGQIGAEGSVYRFTVHAKTIDGGTAATRAAIFLPVSYSKSGSPTRLIIMTNGRHGYLTDSVWNANTDDDIGVIKHYLDNDYAVMVVDNTAKQVNGADDWGNPQLVDSYWKAYEYVTENFNVEEMFSIHSRSMGTFAAVRLMREHPELVKCALMCGAVLSLQTRFGNNPAFIAQRYGFEDTTGTTWEADKVVGYDPYLDVNGLEYDLPPTFWMLAEADATAAHLSTIEKIKNHGNDVTQTIYTKTDHSGVCRLNIEECQADSLAFLDKYQERTAAHRFLAWEQVMEATFDTAGEMRRNCADCSEYESMGIPALAGHSCRDGETNCSTCGILLDRNIGEVSVKRGQFDNNTGAWQDDSTYACVIGYELKKGHTLSLNSTDYVFAVRVLENGSYNKLVREATADHFTASEDMTVALRIRKPDKSELSAEELEEIVLLDTNYVAHVHNYHNGKCTSCGEANPNVSDSPENPVTSGWPKLDTDLTHIVGYGQSFSVGADAPIYPDSPVDGVYVYGSITDSSKGTALAPVPATGTQHPVISAGNSLAQMLSAAGIDTDIIIGSYGSGGRTIAQLMSEERQAQIKAEKGYTYDCLSSGRYQVFQNSVEAIAEYADSNGKTVSCPAIVYLQGETDQNTDQQLGYPDNPARAGYGAGGDKETYKAYMTRLKEDMQQKVMEAYSQTEKPLFIIYQVSGTYTRTQYSSINMAQIEFAQENEDVILVQTPYFTPHYTNSHHLTVNGYRWLGEYIAKYLHIALIEGDKPWPMMPAEIAIETDTSVRITVAGAQSGLTIDTWTVENATNSMNRYGFYLVVNGTRVVPQNVTVSGNQILLTLPDSTPPLQTAESVYVYYAGKDAKGTGNIRDNCHDTGFYAYLDDSNDTGTGNNQGVSHSALDANGESLAGKKYPLYNWLVSFCYELKIPETEQKQPAFYHWEMQDTGMVSVVTDEAKQNDLTLLQGSVESGILKNVQYSMARTVTLYHNKPWVIEWKAAGNGSSYGGGMLLASSEGSGSKADLYLPADSRGFVAWNISSEGRNYGFQLGKNGIDTRTEHIYRIENRIAVDGTNTVCLIVDGVEIGDMHTPYSTSNGALIDDTKNWANGTDLYLRYMGKQTNFLLNNLKLSYLKIWENSCQHSYTSVVTAPTCTEQGYTTHTCTICGDSYVDSYTDVRPLNILMIGNSFSWDAADFWYDMQESMTYHAMKSMLAEPYDIHFAVMYKGSATLAYHATCAMNNTGSYTYTEIGPETGYVWTPSSGINATNSILERLEQRDWDMIVIQSYQHEADGTDPRSTYTGGDSRFEKPEASMGYLMDYFHQHEPDAQVYYYMPWATTKFYGADGTEAGYQAIAEYGKDHMIRMTGTDSGKELAGIIPVGTGIQNARTTYLDELRYSSGTGDTALLKDPQAGLQYDNQHLSFGIGRYIAGVIVAESLIPEGMRKNDYNWPSIKNSPAVGAMPAEYTEIAQKAAAAALKSPYEVTELSGYESDLADRICAQIGKADFTADNIADEAALKQHVEKLIAAHLEDTGDSESNLTINSYTLENGKIMELNATAIIRVGYTTRTAQISVVDGSPHHFGEWTATAVPSEHAMGSEERICSLCGFVQTRKVEGSWQKYGLADHLQKLPDKFCCGTNLWQLMEPEAVMIDHLGNWVSAGATVYSVTIPVAPGDRIYANSFDQTDTKKGIQVSFIGDYGIIKTTFSSGTYQEFHNNGGYLIAPEGAIAVNIPVWNVQDAANTVNILNYDHVEETVVVKPTCTESGCTKDGCSLCNQYTIRDEVPSTGHNFNDWVTITDATCTEKGKEQRDCANCDHYEIREVAANGHIEVIDKAVAATCTETGLTEGKHCSACNTVLVPQKEIPAKGHTWDNGKVTKEPTEQKEGVKTYTCTACGKTKTQSIPVLSHTHKYTSKVTAPTCTEQGYTTYTCTCGDSYADNFVVAKGHSYSTWTVTTTSTCTEKGSERRECNNCDAYETREVAAKGHTEVTDKAVSATCTTAGKTEGKHCSTCGTVLVAQKEIPAKGHTWDAGKVTKEPTEQTEGVKTYTCTVCGETKSQNIPVLSHTHKYTAKVTAPTCTAQGYTTYTCSCGDSYVDNYVQATGHSYGAWTVTTKPTCTEKGQERRDCSNCDAYETREVTAKGHTEVIDKAVDATCTETGLTEGKHCSVCNTVLVAQKEVPAKGHTWDNGKVTKEPTEQTEGMKTYTCTACGETKTETIPTLDHTHKYTSEVTAPTCTAQGYTTYTCTCGDSYVDNYVKANGHSYGAWTVTTKPTCTEKGQERRDCNNCNHYETREVTAKGHAEVIDKAVAATCTTSGLTEGKHCSVCNTMLVAQTKIAALGHSWDVGVVTKEPSEAEEGESVFTCQVCGEEKIQKLPTLSHIHKYDEVVVKPTCAEQGYTTYTCSCGDSYVGDYVEATGHEAGQWQSDKTGHWRVCAVCSEILDMGVHSGENCTICGHETPEQSHGYDLGDVNHDGKINAKDATLILQKSVGVLKETAKFCEDCAEVSGDGKLNAKDSTLILQFSVGLRDSFPAQK